MEKVGPQRPSERMCNCPIVRVSVIVADGVITPSHDDFRRRQTGPYAHGRK